MVDPGELGPDEVLSGRERAESAYRFFARYFNEPYYLAYQGLDVPALLRAHGLVVETSEPWFRSKLWVARKPT